jgi:hypothetical protein
LRNRAGALLQNPSLISPVSSTGQALTKGEAIISPFTVSHFEKGGLRGISFYAFAQLRRCSTTKSLSYLPFAKGDANTPNGASKRGADPSLKINPLSKQIIHKPAPMNRLERGFILKVHPEGQGVRLNTSLWIPDQVGNDV